MERYGGQETVGPTGGCACGLPPATHAGGGRSNVSRFVSRRDRCFLRVFIASIQINSTCSREGAASDGERRLDGLRIDSEIPIFEYHWRSQGQPLFCEKRPRQVRGIVSVDPKWGERRFHLRGRTKESMKTKSSGLGCVVGGLAVLIGLGAAFWLWREKVVTIGVSTAMIVAGLIWTVAYVVKLLTWESIPAEVVGHVAVLGGSKLPSLRCRVKYEWEGEEFEQLDRQASRPTYQVGRTVTWIYPAGSPEKGEIRRWWLGAIYFEIAVAGAYVLWIGLQKL